MATLTGMRVEALDGWTPSEGARHKRVALAKALSNAPRTDRGRPPPAVGQVFASRLLLFLFLAAFVRIALGDMPLSRLWSLLTSQ